jgi:hypothetical protein
MHRRFGVVEEVSAALAQPATAPAHRAFAHRGISATASVVVIREGG